MRKLYQLVILLLLMLTVNYAVASLFIKANKCPDLHVKCFAPTNGEVAGTLIIQTYPTLNNKTCLPIGLNTTYASDIFLHNLCNARFHGFCAPWDCQAYSTLYPRLLDD